MHLPPLLTLLLFAIVLQTAHAQNTLPDYIRIAQANSPLIKDNQNQSAAARVEIQRIKAVFTQPRIGLDGNYQFAPVLSQDNHKTQPELNPANAPGKYIGYDYSLTNGGLYQGLIGISQPLFGDAKYKTAAREAEISIQVNDNNIRLATHDIGKWVTDQYILCLQAYKQITYQAKIIDLLRQQKDLITRLINTGIYKLSDLTLLDIEIQTQNIALNRYQSDYRNDLLDLNILCGVEDTSYHTLPEPDLRLNETPAGSAFSEKYHLDSLSLLGRQQVFELQYKPQVSAFANAGLNALNLSTLPRRFGIGAGISFTMNLYDGHQRRLNQQKTDILLRTAGDYQQQFLTRNAVRKARLLSALQSLRERMALTTAQLAEYDKLLAYYKEELAKGQLSVINYITILKSLISLKNDYTTMERDQQLLINTYNYWNW